MTQSKRPTPHRAPCRPRAPHAACAHMIVIVAAASRRAHVHQHHWPSKSTRARCHPQRHLARWCGSSWWRLVLLVGDGVLRSMHPKLAAPTHIHVRRFIARHTEWGWRRGQSREPETADAVAPTRAHETRRAQRAPCAAAPTSNQGGRRVEKHDRAARVKGVFQLLRRRIERRRGSERASNRGHDRDLEIMFQ